MTPRDAYSLAWSLEFATRRLEGALALAAPSGVFGSHLLRGVWRAACREVHYLEMMVRRLLVALAGQLEVADITGDATASKRKAPPAGDRRAQPHPNDGPWSPANAGAAGAQAERPGNGDKPPLFPASERQMGRADILRRLELSAAETAPGAISCPSNPAQPDPAPVMDTARLAGRFAALAAVLADPEPHAMRLARRMHQGKAVLRLGTAPALARGGTLDLATSAYFEAERLALTVLNRAWTPRGLNPASPPTAQRSGGPTLEDATRRRWSDWGPTFREDLRSQSLPGDGPPDSCAIGGDANCRASRSPP